jgi:hypothetical protein
MSQKVGLFVAVIVVAFLTTGAAAGLPLGIRPVSGSSEISSLAAVWDWLSSLPGWLGTMRVKEGSQMDPNGLNKAGSDMDPDGLSAVGCSGDAGSQMDPNGASGRCLVVGAPTEEGSQMDPDGK